MKEKIIIVTLSCCVFFSCNKDFDYIDNTNVISPDTELLNTGLITGLVYDEYNQPISDYNIELYINGQLLDQVKTNDLGKYELEAPIKKDQDTRLFGYGKSTREILRRITDFNGMSAIDFPVVSIQSDEVPSLIPTDNNLVVVSGFYNDPNNRPVSGYVRIHSNTQQPDVDVVVRPDNSGFFELFVPKEKALILEMVERCDEEEVKGQSIGPLLEDKFLENFTSRYNYDVNETYKVNGNVLNCQGSSLDQYSIVTFTLNEKGVDPLLPSSRIFYFPCEIPDEPYQYFIRDRESKMRSELRTVNITDRTISYGDVELCEADPVSLTIVVDGKKSEFRTNVEVTSAFGPQGISIITLSPNQDNHIQKMDMQIEIDNGKTFISKLNAFDINSNSVLSIDVGDDPLYFDKASYCYINNGNDCVTSSTTLFEGGFHEKKDISLSLYVYQ